MLFSEESTFQQFTVRKNHVRRPMGERFNEKYTISTIKHPSTQIIWGAMHANGMAGIYFLKPGTTINGTKYAEFLKDKIPTHTIAIHQSLVFIHNDAPCHQLKLSSSFNKKSHQDPRLARK